MSRKSDRVRFVTCLAVLAYVIWRFSGFWGTSGDFEGDSPEIREESVDAEEALARVTIYALDNSEFREAWEESVRSAADYLTARVAGARMAARNGKVRRDWSSSLGAHPARIPIPHSIPLEDGRAAFELAVSGEVNRRVEAMNSPGGFG